MKLTANQNSGYFICQIWCVETFCCAIQLMASWTVFPGSSQNTPLLLPLVLLLLWRLPVKT